MLTWFNDENDNILFHTGNPGRFKERLTLYFSLFHFFYDVNVFCTLIKNHLIVLVFFQLSRYCVIVLKCNWYKVFSLSEVWFIFKGKYVYKYIYFLIWA